MEEINLLEVLEYYKNKLIWIIVSIIVVILIGNIFTIATRVPMYKSNTTILLVGSNEKVNQNDVSLNNNLVPTYSEIIKSRNVLNQVIKNLNLDYSVEQLSNSITVGTKTGTQIITVTVSNKDSKKAKDIANEVSIVFSKEIKDLYKLDNVAIIDNAVEASKPYNLTYLKDNVMYFGIGLVLSCGIIFIMFYFDTTIKSAESIEEKLGLTVLGVVPEERRKK